MEQTNSPLVSPEENLPPAPDQPKPNGLDFIRKYATPLAILGGAVIIAVAIYVTFHSPAPSSSKNPASNPPAKTKLVAPTVDGAPVLGAAGAPVTIIEFSDFQCPYCRSFWAETLPALKKNYIDPGKVKLAYRNFPLSIHPAAPVSAEAGLCAREQGKFWELHDKIFTEQQRKGTGTISFGAADLKKWATDLGLDSGQFEGCLASGKYKNEVQKDFSDGIAAGVDATPFFFLNGTPIRGAVPYDALARAIDQELAKKR